MYSNRLFMDPMPGRESAVLPLDLPFTCFYPLETETSLAVTAAASARVARSADPMMNVGIGPAAKITMSLYTDSTFTATHPSGPINLPLGLVMYVGVVVEGVQEDDLVLVLDNCFQTHDGDVNNENKDPLITDQ